jgi:segregation and condensation protein B
MHLVDQLLALLFVSDSPCTSAALAQALGLAEGQVEQGIEFLERQLEESGPLKLNKLAGGYQLSTKAEFAPIVAEFLKPQKQRISRSVLEVLAIVAYRQPVTIADVELVRGVQSDYGIRILLERGMIRDVGRKQAPGRPVLYATTKQFLHAFNLDGVHQLPSIAMDALPARETEAGGLEQPD